MKNAYTQRPYPATNNVGWRAPDEGDKQYGKLDALDDGDILKIAFISGTDDLNARYSDMFFSEEVEKQLFLPSVSETEDDLGCDQDGVK